MAYMIFKKVDLSNSLKNISHINELSNIIDKKNSKLQILLSSTIKNDSSRQKIIFQIKKIYLNLILKMIQIISRFFKWKHGNEKKMGKKFFNNKY